MVQCLNCEPVIQIDGNKNNPGKTSPLAGDSIVDQFLDVPYAQLPARQLRFKKSQNRFRTIQMNYNAFNFPPAFPNIQTNLSLGLSTPRISERCLYLIIWTPSEASPDSRKAVLYWIYGGGLRCGPCGSGRSRLCLGPHGLPTFFYQFGDKSFLQIQESPFAQGDFRCAELLIE
ncbi:hypothetical protein AVEN_162598-1 [Araneus ventricosus]|uniref:Carboxylesterase type B domain-containing protein n=1 Tax=Araneus ventricosus TaxID=182803 RepID=A0A4Y2SVC0_ARAVE|nr:hypothetical protein AVEN_162598-1 [Araneus ventricosus]